MRFKFLQAVTITACALAAITELLSAVRHLERVSLLACWVGLGIYGLPILARRKLSWPALDPFVCACTLACVGILAITGLTAFVSPPNSSDAMAYHMPRVVYWAQQRSVRFFPTPYLNQIMLQPFAEYAMLHLYVLTGTDKFTNLVQWFASAVSLVAVSLAAAKFGAAPRGQALAALFCATLPSGVLASSGAKNDYVLAMWMTLSVCFAFRFVETRKTRDALLLGAAIGLACLTKATAYLFLPWLMCAVLAFRWRPEKRDFRLALAAFLCALLINAPHYSRNFRLSGSILGFDSAQADGVFRWRNEHFGWKVTVSNVSRTISEQLGARSERWNQGVYEAVLTLHRSLHLDANDPSTTWRWAQYTPPRNANHEADGPNRWHLLILFGVAIAALSRASRGGGLIEFAYLAAVLCAFLAFCAYLKWQPFMARLFLPLFVAAAPMVGVVLGKRGLWLQVPLCLLFLDNSRLALLQNWVRPLQGPNSILHAQRDDLYFSDMTTWNNQTSYEQSAQAVVETGCHTVGIDSNLNQLEYPLMHLVRERQPSVEFVHTAVVNPSNQFPPPTSAAPCVVVCLDCAGDPSRLALYPNLGHSSVYGKFVVLSGD